MNSFDEEAMQEDKMVVQYLNTYGFNRLMIML